MKTCISCNTVVTSDFVEFKCPKCGNVRIVRCETCRNASRQYKCGECGFEGP